MQRLKQPEDCTVFNQTVISCIAPPQSWDVIQEIRQKNLELRIFAYRPSDNRLSRNSFKFEYLEHVSANQPMKNNFYGPSGKFENIFKLLDIASLKSILGPICGFCYLQQYNDIKVELSLAKPGVQRRKRGDYNEVPEELKNGFKNKKKDESIGRPEILRKRSGEHSSPEHQLHPNPNPFLQHRSLPEQVKLEPITVRSLETLPGKKPNPLFEIVVNPTDTVNSVMDLSVGRNPNDFLNHHPKKRMLLPSSTEICDQNIKRSRLLHSNE